MKEFAMTSPRHSEPITLPKHLLMWILSHVARPIAGFEHKKNKKGEFISDKEQMWETYYQVMMIATYFYKRGEPEERIISILSHFNY